MPKGYQPRKLTICTCFLIILVLMVSLNAQDLTVGLFKNDPASYQGYTLFNPIRDSVTYLIDNYGRLVHSWESEYNPHLMVYLLEDGSVLRTTRIRIDDESYGGVEKLAWDGTVEWEFPYFGADFTQHHDIELLPNGNVLILATENIPADTAIAAGRDPALLGDTLLLPEYIVEIQPTGPTSGIVVWEWHMWDHIIQDFDSTKQNYGVIAEHPELMDLNYINSTGPDWVHANAIEYNPDIDQIVISLRHINEFWIIDHSTTSGESSSHSGGNHGNGGDILYRWGNPQVYDAGTEDDRKLFYQHDAQWIPPGFSGEGNILVFNNGYNRPDGNYSSVEEIVTTVNSSGFYFQPAPGIAHGPAEAEWIYTADPATDFYSSFISGAQRQPNGNTLVCSGRTGRLFEVTHAGDVVWEYLNPISDTGSTYQGDPAPLATNAVFRCLRYSPDFVGFTGRDLTPGNPIELYNINFSSLEHFPVIPSDLDSVVFTVIINGQNPIVSANLYLDSGSGFSAVVLHDDGLHHDGLPNDNLYGTVIAPLTANTKVRYYATAEDNTTYSLKDPFIAPVTSYRFQVSGPEYICGDADGSSAVDISDAVYLIAYIFGGGPVPIPLVSGDPDCSNAVDISDAVYLINYIFSGGPAPCASCP